MNRVDRSAIARLSSERLHRSVGISPVLIAVLAALTAIAPFYGGMGVTQKALARGVPVCVVPYGRDQFEVARRVEIAKCGTWLPPKNLTAPRLRDKVMQAMAMTEGACRVATGYVATGGVAHGADLIEQRLLASPRLRSRPA